MLFNIYHVLNSLSQSLRPSLTHRRLDRVGHVIRGAIPVEYGGRTAASVVLQHRFGVPRIDLETLFDHEHLVIISPAPREVSYGRIEGRVPSGTRQVLVRVGGQELAKKNVTRRRFVVAVSLPTRDVTIRVTAVDARGRRSSTLVGPVYGLPREAARAISADP